MVRIAGPAGPSPKLAQDLRSLLQAPQDEMLRFVTWLSASEHPLPSGWRDYGPIAKEINVSRELLNDHFALIQFVMANWRAEGLTLDEVLLDFQELGLSTEEVESARSLFAPLEQSIQRFFIASLRGQAELIGLPTIDDLRATWDVRPVFEKMPLWMDDPSSSSDAWLTNTYLLLLEFAYSNRTGSRQTLSLQLSEADLDYLEETLSRAKSQLQSLKRKQFV